MDPRTAAGYHGLTCYERARMKGGGLDWANPPRPYKVYPGIDPVPLPRDRRFPEIPLQDLYAFQEQGFKTASENLSEKDLSRILFLAYGLTARRQALGEDFFFRSVPSAGALYPSEIYLSAMTVDGIPDGLYHFDTIQHALVPLRKGVLPDFRVPQGSPLQISEAQAVLWVSGIFFRSSWKYRERAYRYVLMDAGHLIENLVLSLKASGRTPEVMLDFDDEKALLLTGVDPLKEACLAQITIESPSPGKRRKRPPLSPLTPEIAAASCVSAKESLFPEIIDIHRSGYAVKPGAQAEGSMEEALGLSAKAWVPFPLHEAAPETLSFAQSALRRRSHRNFVPKPLEKGAFCRLFHLVSAAASAYRSNPSFGDVISCGLLVNAVEGFDPGFYLMDAAGHATAQVRSGAFAPSMASICLDQMWLENASVHFLFMSNLKSLDRTWGPRGYRYAMVAAGRLGQAVYLACTALDLGCCGIGAFYDGEAKRLLALDPDAALLYLVAAGHVRKLL